MAFKEKVFHKEENCLNCGYPLIGKYCGQCGQKAFLHKDSFWHMAAHFASDYFHYDNKFWTTLNALFTKPGLATLEYIKGKRAKYLNPIQLYIFVTTVFFLFFFNLSMNIGKVVSSTKNNGYQPAVSPQQIDSIARSEAGKILKDTIDSKTFAEAKKISTQINPGETLIDLNNELNASPTDKAENWQVYDSAQQRLPAAKRDGFIGRLIHKRIFAISAKYHRNEDIQHAFIEKFQHNIPKVFFVLLPFFAFLLHLFFRNKGYYYVDHLIFSIHFHSMLFIMASIPRFLFKLYPDTHLYEIISGIIYVILGLYLFIALRRVYPSVWWKLLLKQTGLFIIYVTGFFLVALAGISFTFFFM